MSQLIAVFSRSMHCPVGMRKRIEKEYEIKFR